MVNKDKYPASSQTTKLFLPLFKNAIYKIGDVKTPEIYFVYYNVFRSHSPIVPFSCPEHKNSFS